MNYTNPEFDDARKWIRRKREQNFSWDAITLGLKDDESSLRIFLQYQKDENDWPPMSVEEWQYLVNLQREAEEHTQRVDEADGAATLHDASEDNAVTIPGHPESSWQTYRNGLIVDNHFAESTVDTIERATIKILKRLSLKTQHISPVKGMVIGNVQSGKTANMAALMAMAADWGWNMFIILSGTIDNLRKQTQSRLFSDLNKSNCHIRWRSLEHLKRNMSVGDRAQDMHFEDTSRDRYFTVCLKNSTRLRNLIQWLQYSPTSQSQMKILVIDDEADQAGINTADITRQERRRINELICALVGGSNENNEEIESHYKAMNYIGYTATPYANFLNEAYEESLYPRNFISTLSVSKEYFGPQQIFGVDNGDYDGMDIIRVVPTNPTNSDTTEVCDVEQVKSIHSGDDTKLPPTMIDAICWFMCGVACMRYWGYEKPISMLVHTSQKTQHHANLATSIFAWVNESNIDDIVCRCSLVWERETKQFSLKKFKEQYFDYGAKDRVQDYPLFSVIKSELVDLLGGCRISHIKLNQDSELTYHKGIHLCVDNCTNNGVTGDDYVRLAYPDKDHMPNYAPAFIVVGGATLSRGLTIEGLISTFFLRTVGQADTLMQMGRWFGYRRGYELLPRIWITERTWRQFSFLSLLDQDLREEIRDMEIRGVSPAEYGPKVLNSPMASLIRITAQNRMQAARTAELDYSGCFKQTYLFDTDVEVLRANLSLLKSFLSKLPNTQRKSNATKNALVWRDIPFSTVRDFLREYKFHARLSVLNNISPLMDWIEEITKKGCLENWNIVLAGKESYHDEANIFSFGSSPMQNITKVTRTRKIKPNSSEPDYSVFDIGVLRTPQDMIADVDYEHVPSEVASYIRNFKSQFAKNIRRMAGLGSTPQLLLYIVDKDSVANEGSHTRCNLSSSVDLAGVCINIPSGNSDRTNYVAKVSIPMATLNENLFNDKGDIDGADAD